MQVLAPRVTISWELDEFPSQRMESELEGKIQTQVRRRKLETQLESASGLVWGGRASYWIVTEGQEALYLHARASATRVAFQVHNSLQNASPVL